MKPFGLLLLASLHLAAGLPQHDHDHSSTASSSTPATSSSSSSAPAATGSTPAGCRVISTDKDWPAASVWASTLQGAEAKHPVDGITRPDYHFQALNAADVQKAVTFAAKSNIRLSIVNSGHDFMGRNDAPSGLALDISQLQGIKVLQSFTPTAAGAASPDPNAEVNVITPIPGTQAAVTIGAGVAGQVLTNALHKSRLFALSAAHGSVKPAGGWGQTAGHSPLSSSYGLGVDQVLEYKVVTADGQLRVANKVSNTDLFWALRGGGGGTFGVVVEATLKVYPTPKITITNWWINATNKENPGLGYWQAAEYFHKQLPAVNAKGMQGYYYIYKDAMKGIFLSIDENSGEEKAAAIWEPIVEKMATYPGLTGAALKYFQYSSFKECYDARFGPLEGECEAEEQALVKRHGEMAEPMGIVPMDSRLLGESHLKSLLLGTALASAFPNFPDGMLRGHVVGGQKVFKPDDDTSVLPAWRKAYVHLIGTGRGLVQTPSLRILAPDSGAYANEASLVNPNWKKDFWGTNYQRLSQIKTKYDPNGLFWVTPGINADLYEVKNGRVCKAARTNDNLAPTNDNQNIAQMATGNEDLLSYFPGTAPPADDGHTHTHGGGGCETEEHEEEEPVEPVDPEDPEEPIEPPDDGHTHEHGSIPEESLESAPVERRQEDPHAGHNIPAGFVEEPDLDITKRPTTPNAQFTKIRYGPYTLSPGGMLTNIPVLNIQKPCTNCYIVAQQGGLEYLDGTVANVDTGAWLHHMVLMNTGSGKGDTVCAIWPQRTYASGNERTTSRINSVANYGLKIDTADTMMMIFELMSESESWMSVYITMVYEWVPASLAIGYKTAVVAWLDVTGCGISSTAAREGVFELKSAGWRSTIAGRLLFASGHVHDGGIETAILQNGKEVCVSYQLYGMKPGFTSVAGDGHAHGGAHISTSGVCKNFGTVKVGDNLQVIARYNTTAHPLVQGHDGRPHAIMGISRTHIGPL